MGIGDEFKVQGIAGAKTWRCEDSLMCWEAKRGQRGWEAKHQTLVGDEAGGSQGLDNVFLTLCTIIYRVHR